ncbi:MAG: transposase [Chitinispirillaceae bacterium]
MSTKPRIIVPHAVYQIRSEITPGLDLFPTKDHELFFLSKLDSMLKSANYVLVDMCLQQDHYHLVVKTSEETVSWFMRTFNSVIAKNINKYYERHGTVFPKRFSSAILDENHSLKDIACHVHLNPLRSERVVSAKRDGRCHCCSIIKGFGPEHTRKHQNHLDRNINVPRYMENIGRLRHANKQGQDYTDPHTCIIGKEDFVNSAIYEHNLLYDRKKADLMREPKPHLEGLHKDLSTRLPLKQKELFLRGYNNNRSKNREIMVLRGIFQLRFSGADLARYLGITRSAVSKIISRTAGCPRRYSRICEMLKAFS